MEMQMKSPVPILSSQLGSMQGRRRRGMRAALGAPSLAGGRASATCARRRARRRRGPGPLPRHAPRSAHLRGGEARAGRTSPCRARWRGGARGPQHRRVESQHWEEWRQNAHSIILSRKQYRTCRGFTPPATSDTLKSEPGELNWERMGFSPIDVFRIITLMIETHKRT